MQSHFLCVFVPLRLKNHAKSRIQNFMYEFKLHFVRIHSRSLDGLQCYEHSAQVSYGGE